jgi:hypothetical protein
MGGDIPVGSVVLLNHFDVRYHASRRVKEYDQF